MTKYLNFRGASDAGHFEYYDKEAGENVKYKLTNLKVTDVCYTVKGFDEESNSAIYSNDIKNFKEEELNVRCKSGSLFEGLYNKEKILALGAKLHIKVVGVDKDGEEIIIFLKGLNFFQLSEVLKDQGVRNGKTTLKFEGTTDGKKGAVKFKSTQFAVGEAIKDGEYEIKEALTVEDCPF